MTYTVKPHKKCEDCDNGVGFGNDIPYDVLKDNVVMWVLPSKRRAEGVANTMNGIPDADILPHF